MITFPEMASNTSLSGLRIGFFTSVIGMGGSEVLVADAIEAAVRSGAEVICWSHPAAAIRQILANRAYEVQVTIRDWPRSEATGGLTTTSAPVRNVRRRIYRRLTPSSLKRLSGFFKEANAFRAELREANPHLLFVNVNGSEAACLAGAWQRRKVISCYHLSVTPCPGRPWDSCLDRFAKVLSAWSSDLMVHTSEACARQWCWHVGYPKGKTRLIYNGVDDPASEPAKAFVLPSAGHFTFCVPGRLHEIKGHRYLLDALSKSPEDFRQARILVAGDGPLREALEERCRAEDLLAIVHFLGWRRDLKQILALSDFTILPSIASENCSVAVLESLMAGTPAIVTSVGGMAEVIRDGVTGLVVPPADAGAMRTAMLRAMRDKRWAEEAGRAARADALTRFTRQRMLAQYAQVLKEVSC